MDVRSTETGVKTDLASIARLVTATIHENDRGKDQFLAYINEVLPPSDIWSVPVRRAPQD